MATPTAIIGIDPGKSGGIAVLWPSGIYQAWKLPATERDLWEVLNEIDHIALSESLNCTAFIEKVSSSPQMGVVSAFKFGRSLGLVHMGCICIGWRVEWVTAQKWQRALGLKVSGKGLGQDDTSKKNRNKAKAQELFPDAKITHALADALLLAEFGRRQHYTLTEAQNGATSGH